MEVNSEKVQHEKVIIIGAGISGFAAASRLLENNITSFRILEAEDRIGGRINSVHMGEGFIDLGAQYIHGEQGNVIYELARDYINISEHEELPQLYYSNGEKIENSLMQGFFQQLFEMEDNPGSPNISLSEAFLARYNSHILSKYKENTKTQKIAKEFIKTVEEIFLTIEGSFDWHIARSKFHNFKVYPGNPLISWSTKGYKTIFDILKTKIGTDNSRKLEARIHLKKSVKNVTTGGNNIINIECQDGSKFTADHVIFTASLGVLKHVYKEMFHPGFDEVEVNAIEALGIGGIMKVGLEFSERWWQNETDIYLVWSDEDERRLFKDIAFGPSKDGKHWLSAVHCISPAPNNPKVVIAWISGHLVPEIEQLNIQQLKEGITYVLKKFFGKKQEIKEPIAIKHSRWCTNPNFRGSFSYEPIKVADMKNSPHSDLLKPVLDENDIPRILFAGEATHPTRFSAADGALASGFLQADKLLNFWRGKKLMD